MNKDKNLKILYLVNAALPNNRAHGIQIVNTCDGISKTGANLTLLTPAFFGKKKSLEEHYGIHQSFRHTRIPALDLPFSKHRHIIRTLSYFLSVNIYILVLLVHSFFTRKKLILYVRGETILSLGLASFLVPTYFETHQIRNYEKLYVRALKRSAGVMTVTDRLRKKFIVEYGIEASKIICARDSVNMEKFSDVVSDKKIWSKYGISSDKKIILYTGSLAKEKGVDTLFETAKKLSDAHVVFIGGSDIDTERYRKMYKDYKNISILGYIDHTKIPKYMASSDVLVLPDLATDRYSNLYTSPMKLFEYMASDKVIVAADIPSLREVLSEESAYLFKSGDSDSLKEAIERALADETASSKLSSKAKEIVSDITWEKRGERIVDLIRRTI